MPKRAIYSDKVFRGSLPFAPATVAGGFMFVCCVGLDRAGKYAVGDVRKQTQQCLDNIRALIEELSSSKYGYDQLMLAFKLWPIIRNHALVHDRHYTLAGVNTVPITHENLGAGYQNLASIRKEIDRLGIAPVVGLDEGAVWQ